LIQPLRASEPASLSNEMNQSRYLVKTLSVRLFVCAVLCELPVAAAIDFATEVAPIFQQHCVRCHNQGSRKGDVSLATFADLEEYGYVDPDAPEDSYLIDLVAGIDGERPEMPLDGEPLSDEEVAVIRQWIRDGANWPDDVVIREKSKADATWWAYQPLNVARLAESTGFDMPDSETPATAIDEFIRARLVEHDLDLNPPADRRSLIRRATYDLIGLPPTPEEVNAFLNDPDPQAYEKLIDRLLASPHYGERWGRHWLDVVRFGESNGFERNFVINDLWPFRDYVIRSLNQDKPFDQFIREHIAGDVFGKDHPQVAVGTAFLVAGPYDDVRNQDLVQAAQIRANTLDEIINATGEAFLGMTLGCARCHDHKFDPITQEDYYGLYATFSGIRHGSIALATPQVQKKRATTLKPLNERKTEIEKALVVRDAAILKRAREKLAAYKATWTREPVDRTGTEDRFTPVMAKFVRLVCEAQDVNPNSATGYGIDEFEIWSAPSADPFSESNSRNRESKSQKTTNVALASHGGRATGQARIIEDFPGAYGAHLAIDGKTGARFLATGSELTIELAQPTMIDRVLFSSARNETTPEQRKFTFVAEYRIEVSIDGKTWQEVSSSQDRKPIPRPAFVNHRLLRLETNDRDREAKQRLKQQLAVVNREIANVPALPTVWIGQRVGADAQGPFHVFLGGSPQQKGDEIVPASLSVFGDAVDRSSEVSSRPPDSVSHATINHSASQTSAPGDFVYRLNPEVPESVRRQALADWIVHPDNPLTPRVLANRLWHYHFGTGIVDTPSDFGYMGGRPTHPELLDYLAVQLQANDWRIKPMHRMIMLSDTYRQSSAPRDEASRIDGDARLLWRFPPRRLSAEEIRDTVLMVAGKLNTTPGGPGFRLYHFMQDNVCTYVPLDKHGEDTYRRAIYHQNARASVVDLMTEYDQPDCTFSAPKRAETTTPLQALTMLNHSFTLDMARALADRLEQAAGGDPQAQIRQAYQLCYARQPTTEERRACHELQKEHGLTALCRVLLNTSELIYIQ